MTPSTPISSLVRLDEAHKKALARLRLVTVMDLLYHLPTRYENVADIQAISSLREGSEAIIYGQVGGLKTRKAWKSRRPIAEGWIEDGTSRIKVIWFNQPYLAKMLVNGAQVKMVGKIAGKGHSA